MDAIQSVADAAGGVYSTVSAIHGRYPGRVYNAISANTWTLSRVLNTPWRSSGKITTRLLLLVQYLDVIHSVTHAVDVIG